jgi:hypothetical protein
LNELPLNVRDTDLFKYFHYKWSSKSHYLFYNGDKNYQVLRMRLWWNCSSLNIYSSKILFNRPFASVVKLSQPTTNFMIVRFDNIIHVLLNTSLNIIAPLLEIILFGTEANEIISSDHKYIKLTKMSETWHIEISFIQYRSRFTH